MCFMKMLITWSIANSDISSKKNIFRGGYEHVQKKS